MTTEEEPEPGLGPTLHELYHQLRTLRWQLQGLALGVVLIVVIFFILLLLVLAR